MYKKQCNNFACLESLVKSQLHFLLRSVLKSDPLQATAKQTRQVEQIRQLQAVELLKNLICVLPLWGKKHIKSYQIPSFPLGGPRMISDAQGAITEPCGHIGRRGEGHRIRDLRGGRARPVCRWKGPLKRPETASVAFEWNIPPLLVLDGVGWFYQAEDRQADAGTTCGRSATEH